MRYLNTKKKKTYWRELGIVSLVFFIFLLYIFLPKLIIGSADFAGRLGAPIFNLLGKSDMGDDSWSLLFSQKKTLLEENRLLSERLSLFEGKALLSDLLLAENNTLKRSGEGEVNASTTKILAPVVARGGLLVYSTFTIGLGRDDGIEKGDFVLSESDYLLGTITRADGHNALVTLFSADGLKRDVFVGQKHSLLQAKGMGSNNFIIEAPHEAGVIIGDAVINAEGGSFPLGVVERIKYNPADPFETIRFQHPVNISDLRFVLVVPSL